MRWRRRIGHPPGHASFASVHPGKEPFETIKLDYGDQTLWPDHCVQTSSGAALHPSLDVRRVEMVIRKGFRPGIDSYSGFRENDRRTKTGLHGYLEERGFRRLFIVGLARDYCGPIHGAGRLGAGLRGERPGGIAAVRSTRRGLTRRGEP